MDIVNQKNLNPLEKQLKDKVLKHAKKGEIDTIVKTVQKCPGTKKKCLAALAGGTNSKDLLCNIIEILAQDDIPAEVIGIIGKNVRRETLLDEIKNGNIDILKTLQKEEAPLLNSESFILKAVALNPDVLQMASYDLRTNPHFMTACIAENVECYEHLDPLLKNNATYTMGMLVELNQKFRFNGEAMQRLGKEMSEDSGFKQHFNNGSSFEGNFEDLCKTVIEKEQFDNAASTQAVAQFLSDVTQSEISTLTNEQLAAARELNVQIGNTTQPNMFDNLFNIFRGKMRPLINEGGKKMAMPLKDVPIIRTVVNTILNGTNNPTILQSQIIGANVGVTNDMLNYTGNTLNGTDPVAELTPEYVPDFAAQMVFRQGITSI